MATEWRAMSRGAEYTEDNPGVLPESFEHDLGEVWSETFEKLARGGPGSRIPKPVALESAARHVARATEATGMGVGAASGAAGKIAAMAAMKAGSSYASGAQKALGSIQKGLRDQSAISTVLATQIVEANRLMADVLFESITHPVADPESELTYEEARVLDEGGATLPDEHISGTQDPAMHSAARRALLLSEGLDTQAAARALGIKSESRVRQRIADGTLYAVKVGREWRLPLFQFELDEQGNPVREIPNIAYVLQALPRDALPLEIHNWLSEPRDYLHDEKADRTLSPVEWLSTGGSVQRLVQAARSL